MRYITDIELNKQLEALGLVVTKDRSNYQLDMASGFEYLQFDIADLLEPENARLLWGGSNPDKWHTHMSTVLVIKYHTSPDKWQDWLKDQLAEGEDGN